MSSLATGAFDHVPRTPQGHFLLHFYAGVDSLLRYLNRLDLAVGDEVLEPDLPWIVIVWNDPINLMTYVTWVFMRLFGYPRERAEKLMWDVHTKGRAVVSSGPREKAEADVARLHAHGLWATLQRDA